MNSKLRDVLLFVGGFAGMMHQTVLIAQPQAVLVGAFLAMMVGAPALSRLLDRWENRGR